MTRALPSAVCVLLREGSSEARGALEVLLLRRHPRLRFHGGAWVFPGGRVDASDTRAEGELASARWAAAREAREEAGLTISPEALVPDAHWTSPLSSPQRFSAWYFWGLAPPTTVVPDGNEITHHRWLTPTRALSLAAAGELELPPPTFVTLVKLAHYSSIAAALSALTARGPERFTPRPLSLSRGSVSLYEGDAGYDSQDPNAPGPRRRLWMTPAGWRFEQRLSQPPDRT